MVRESYRVQFAGGSGFQLAGIVDRPKETPDAPALVFSHCFTCNKDLKAIVRIARGLAENGIAVLRFDMTGLGNSDGEFAETNFTTNLADLNAAIEFARNELGSSIALMGHSFGGAASMAIAGSAEARKQITALITLAAPSDTQHLAALLARMDPAIETHGAGKVTIGGLTWDIHRQMLDDFRAHDLTALIPQIQSPTLLLHSPIDATVGYDHAIRIMGLIQQSPLQPPNETTPVSLVTLPGADHLLATNPDDLDFVIGIVSSFVKRHASAATTALESR